MSFFYNLLFGQPTPVKEQKEIPSHIQAIRSLLEREVQLEKKISFTQTRIQQFVDEAKECVTKQQKTKALSILKQKGILEEQERSYLSMLEKLTQQRLALEMNSMQKETIDAIKGGNEVLQASEKTMDTEKVQELFEKYDEHIQTQNDISRIFSEPLFTDKVQEEAEEELRKMMDEQDNSSAYQISLSETKESKETKETKETKESNDVPMRMALPS